MSSVVIIGAGQQGRNCKRLVRLNGHRMYCFVDEYEKGPIEGVVVYNKISAIPNPGQHRYIVAIGDLDVREKFIKELEEKGLRGITLIDPTADIEEGAVIGDGNYISKFVTVYGSAVIGNHNIVNCKACVATDAVIGNNCNLSMGCNICGAVEVGDNTYIGYQATIKSGYTVGARCHVEPYAFVDYDIKDGRASHGKAKELRDIHSELQKG